MSDPRTIAASVRTDPLGMGMTVHGRLVELRIGEVEAGGTFDVTVLVDGVEQASRPVVAAGPWPRAEQAVRAIERGETP